MRHGFHRFLTADQPGPAFEFPPNRASLRVNRMNDFSVIQSEKGVGCEMSDFSHLDDEGRARMVDVSHKPVTARTARASCLVQMQPETLEQVRQHHIGKGDVLQIARVAGIMAAKQTASLIPLCHPLELQQIEVTFEMTPPQTLSITTLVKSSGHTGVEMEALTAASVAALTVYDMCKSVDRGMVIGQLQLEEKSGGASGHFQRKDDDE